MERDALMRMKFGAEGLKPGAGRAIAEAGEGVGLSIDYSQIERVPNSVDAHRLSLWASGQGKGDEVAEGLFRAYFSEGRDIGRVETLVEIGQDAGLDANLLTELFESDRDIERIEAEAEDYRARGIPGVPSHLIERAGMLVGAQTPDAIAAGVTQVEEKLARKAARA
jgi:predicted DsbA family dithiol-disulfide isomerase